jgi:hypothetical protein
MLIAKVVSSNSHTDYVARVLDAFDAADTPSPEDHGFGTFVSIPVGQDRIVGVIYNTLLVNPEFASYGPRLSPRPDLGSFSPDYLNEQGILIGILILGTLSEKGAASQSLPPRPLAPGDGVFRLSEEDIYAFHRGADGGLAIHYYPQVVAQAGNFAVPLLESVIDRLGYAADEREKKRLEVLRQNLSWQRTVGSARL